MFPAFEGFYSHIIFYSRACATEVIQYIKLQRYTNLQRAIMCVSIDILFVKWFGQSPLFCDLALAVGMSIMANSSLSHGQTPSSFHISYIIKQLEAYTFHTKSS